MEEERSEVHISLIDRQWLKVWSDGQRHDRNKTRELEIRRFGQEVSGEMS